MIQSSINKMIGTTMAAGAFKANKKAPEMESVSPYQSNMMEDFQRNYNLAKKIDAANDVAQAKVKAIAKQKKMVLERMDQLKQSKKENRKGIMKAKGKAAVIAGLKELAGGKKNG